MSELLDLSKLIALAERAKRPYQVVLEDGSRRLAIYNDAKDEYEIQPEPDEMPRRTQTVVDIVSLADLVKCEADRIAQENPDGDDSGLFMTASFGGDGGVVYLREDRGERGHHVKFHRAMSFPLRALREAMSTARQHADFLNCLANLAPWMQNSKAVLAAYRKVSIETTAGLASSPYLEEDGTKGESWKCSIKVTPTGPTQTASLPATLHLTMPFSLRSPAQYDVEAYVDVATTVNPENNRHRALFRLICPSLATALEKAIEDEVVFFESTVKDRLPKIVTVREG